MSLSSLIIHEVPCGPSRPGRVPRPLCPERSPVPRHTTPRPDPGGGRVPANVTDGTIRDVLMFFCGVFHFSVGVSPAHGP